VAQTTPQTERGMRTRGALLTAAEQIFLAHGYHEASVVKITEQAGVSQGTFYLYFESKKQVFDELVVDLNRRVRQAMSEGASRGRNRREAEHLGFAAFFRFTSEHPALYRMIRQAEFVSPEMHKLHYSRIVDGYIEALTDARNAGEIADLDPSVTAWALMGVGEIVGMRWVLWGEAPGHVPDDVMDEIANLIDRVLGLPVATKPAQRARAVRAKR
jgi:AcrR family transcriptional regulator